MEGFESGGNVMSPTMPHLRDLGFQPFGTVDLTVKD
jgi:hypothetical protein